MVPSHCQDSFWKLDTTSPESAHYISNNTDKYPRYTRYESLWGALVKKLWGHCSTSLKISGHTHYVSVKAGLSWDISFKVKDKQLHFIIHPLLRGKQDAW